MFYSVRVVHDPTKQPHYTAYAYAGQIDQTAQFLPGADFSGRGETAEAATNNLRQQMRDWQQKQDDVWLPITWDQNGDPVGVA